MTTRNTPTQQRNRPETADSTDSRGSTRDGAIPSAHGRVGFTDDSRGVSEVLGAILMFGLLIALLVLIQVNAVPAQNQQVEFEHNQRVEQDMLGLDRAILQSGMLDVPGSSEIELSAHYPSRFFLINPSVGTGTIETTGTGGSIKITGANMTGVSNYWNDDSQPKTFQTTGIRYRPNYKEYANAPYTVYEHNALVNVFDPSVGIAVGSASFIDGNQITLITVEGEFSRASARAVSLETAPVSAPAQTVTLENSSSQNININLTTTLSEDHWNTIVEDKEAIKGVSFTHGEPYNHINVTLADGTYELRMARVGIGGSVHQTSLKPRYLAALDEPRTESIRPTETKELRVQLRDRFNNPVNGTVRFSVSAGNGVFVNDDGAEVNELRVDADENGVARGLFEATTVGEPNVTVAIVSETEPATKTSEHEVNYTIDVSEVGRDTNEDSLSRINPRDTISISRLDTPGQKIFFGFSNGINEDVEIVRIRSMFFVSNNQNNPTKFTVATGDGLVERQTGQGNSNRTTTELEHGEQVSFSNETLGTPTTSKVSIGSDWYNISSPSITVTKNRENDVIWEIDFLTDNAVLGTLGMTVEYRAKGGGTFTETYFIQIL